VPASAVLTYGCGWARGGDIVLSLNLAATEIVGRPLLLMVRLPAPAAGWQHVALVRARQGGQDGYAIAYTIPGEPWLYLARPQGPDGTLWESGPTTIQGTVPVTIGGRQ
jgi:hypothetical protein